jgi:predicted porin
MLIRRLSAIAVLLATCAASEPLRAEPCAVVAAGIFGRVHVSADWVDNEKQTGSRMLDHSLWVGVRGCREVRPSLAALMYVEEDFHLDHGILVHKHRDAFLGLNGSFGALRAGYMDTPLREAGKTGDLFNGQAGDSRNLTRLRSALSGADFERRLPNSISYRTPQSHGLDVQVQYSFDTAAANRPEGAGDRVWAAGATWASKRFTVSLGHQQDIAARHDNLLLPWATRLGTRASFGRWIVVTLMQLARLQMDEEVLTLGAGASRKLGSVFTLKAQAYQMNSSSAARDGCMLAFGADWRPRDDLYVQLSYATAHNEPLARYNVADFTTAQLNPRAGARNRVLSLLVRYDF